MKPLVFISFISLFIGLCSCNSGSMVSRATGAPYEIVVVADKVLWDGTVGELIKEELTSPIPYLPQEESAMRYSYVRPDQFETFLRYMRNVLIVNIDKTQYTKLTLLKSSDKWAVGQSILYLNAPDTLMVEAYLTENKGVLVNHYTNEEMRRAREFLYKTYSQRVMDDLKDKIGITMYAPSDITSYRYGENCLWFSNNASQGRMDLLIYSFPFTDKNTFTLDYLVAKRDSVAKIMLPGSFEGSYMSTEKRVVDYFSSSLHGKYCGIVRGLWRMEGGDMMGGPFVSYARVDEQNQRVIVTEGFVYEPKKDKRNYIRRLEAALQTTRFPGDTQGQAIVALEEEETKKE